jgi:hypothetical protein
MILDFNFFTKLSSFLYFSISSQITLEIKGIIISLLLVFFCSIGVFRPRWNFCIYLPHLAPPACSMKLLPYEISTYLLPCSSAGFREIKMVIPRRVHYHRSSLMYYLPLKHATNFRSWSVNASFPNS